MEEELTPQACLQVIVVEERQQTELLRSMRRHLIVIAIPFWLAICSMLLGVLFYLLIALGMVAS